MSRSPTWIIAPPIRDASTANVARIFLPLDRSSRRTRSSRSVALNCVAVERIVNSGCFDDVFVQPTATDAGSALGAAALAHVNRLPVLFLPGDIFASPAHFGRPTEDVARDLVPELLSDQATRARGDAVGDSRASRAQRDAGIA